MDLQYVQGVVPHVQEEDRHVLEEVPHVRVARQYAPEEGHHVQAVVRRVRVVQCVPAEDRRVPVHHVQAVVHHDPEAVQLVVVLPSLEEVLAFPEVLPFLVVVVHPCLSNLTIFKPSNK